MNVKFASACICAEGHDLSSNMAAKTNHGKSLIQYQVDQLVYELYGLTDKETRIIETIQSRRQIDESTRN